MKNLIADLKKRKMYVEVLSSTTAVVKRNAKARKSVVFTEKDMCGTDGVVLTGTTTAADLIVVLDRQYAKKKETLTDRINADNNKTWYSYN